LTRFWTFNPSITCGSDDVVDAFVLSQSVSLPGGWVNSFYPFGAPGCGDPSCGRIFSYPPFCDDFSVFAISFLPFFLFVRFSCFSPDLRGHQPCSIPLLFGLDVQFSLGLSGIFFVSKFFQGAHWLYLSKDFSQYSFFFVALALPDFIRKRPCWFSSRPQTCSPLLPDGLFLPLHSLPGFSA